MTISTTLCGSGPMSDPLILSLIIIASSVASDIEVLLPGFCVWGFIIPISESDPGCVSGFPTVMRELTLSFCVPGAFLTRLLHDHGKMSITQALVITCRVLKLCIVFPFFQPTSPNILNPSYTSSCGNSNNQLHLVQKFCHVSGSHPNREFAPSFWGFFHSVKSNILGKCSQIINSPLSVFIF